MSDEESLQRWVLRTRIMGRYTKPNSPILDRRNWTPKQKRRIRHRLRKHGITVPIEFR